MGSAKKILILGGGYYNVPLIRRSVELGYYTIVGGIAGNYPGYDMADLWVDVDVFNKEAVLAVAKKNGVDAVYATGSDTVMPTIGYVNDCLHLIGPTADCVLAATNKAEMKKHFLSAGVRTAAYRKITTQEEAIDFANTHSYPVVLKVVDACGGRGIAIVHSEEELLRDYPIVCRETHLGYMIVEEYIRGEEFGAQAFVQNGALVFVMPHGDIVHHGLTDVPVGHYAPYERTDELMADIEEQLYLCIKALGIQTAPINADFILSNGKVYVLEIGVRAGATCLPELVSCHYDIDYYAYLLRMCLGEETHFAAQPRSACWVETLQTEQSGIVKSISLPSLPADVQEFNLYPQVGEKVHPFRTAYDRIGTLVLKGESVAYLKALRDSIIQGIRIEVEK